MKKPHNTLGVRSQCSKGCDAGPGPHHPLRVLSGSKAQIADLSGNQICNSWALTESIHTRKEIFHSGHPTNIQHH
jgi:hypothetical protein